MATASSTVAGDVRGEAGANPPQVKIKRHSVAQPRLAPSANYYHYYSVLLLRSVEYGVLPTRLHSPRDMEVL